MYYYRTVCLKSEITQILSLSQVVYKYDKWAQEDFIVVCHRNLRKVLLFNIKTILNKIDDETLYGIVICLEEQEENGIEDIEQRYIQGGKKVSEIKIEDVMEEKEQYSDDDLYNINSWGADLSFREIISMYDEDELLKPELQRKYVWSKVEASRFIDSILLGLPVPSVFFAKEPNETMLIIDGFQRIMTVYDFVNGIFSGDGKIFRLSNTGNINERWKGKAFRELSIEEQRRIRNTTIHAIIFEQKHPKNDTGMFQIFERINTGGRTLKAQEIRNCIYQGRCNNLLIELNKYKIWREILGTDKEDARMTDMELILRFFAMSELHNREERDRKQINLTRYLNRYMGDKTDATEDIIKEMEQNFILTINACKNAFGDAAFRNLKKASEDFTNKISPTIFDAITVATSYAIKKNSVDFEKNDYRKNYIDLLKNKDFENINLINDSCMNMNKYLKNNSVDGIIFSPPYANCFDYTEIYKLELWFGGFVHEYADLKKLRCKSLHSHLNGNLNPEVESRSEFLSILVDKLSEKKLWDKKMQR